MREIKFRAWMPSESKMIHKFNIVTLVDVWHTTTFDEIFGDDDYVFMQFTGLIDKNGKEIYEGDLVKVYDSEIRVVEFKHAFWNLEPIDANRLGGFGTDNEGQFKPLYRYGENGIEVVGNIYENQVV